MIYYPSSSLVESLRRLFKRRVGDAVPAYLGDSDMPGARTDVPGRTGYVYVRLRRTDKPFMARSGQGAYPNYPGATVYVAYRYQGEPEIVGTNYAALDQVGIDTRVLNPLNQQSKWVYPYQLTYGLASAVASTITDSFLVTVKKFRHYTGNVIAAFETPLEADKIDLSSYIPAADMHCYAAVWIDTYLNQAVVTTSVTQSIYTPLDETDIQELVVRAASSRPPDGTPLKAFYLANNQGTLKQSTLEVDLRLWLYNPPVHGFPSTLTTLERVRPGYTLVTGPYTTSGVGALTVESGGQVITVHLNNLNATTNPGVNDDSGDGYSIESAWFNKSTGALYVAEDVTIGAAVWTVVTAPGSYTSWTLAGDSGTPQTINDGNTATIAGGDGIDTTASATDTLTVAVDSTVIRTTGAQSMASKAITGGSIDNTPIGATTPSTGVFSNALKVIGSLGFYMQLVNNNTANRTVTFPDATFTVVGTGVTQTLTNKTLTGPTINTPTIANGTMSGTAVSSVAVSGSTVDSTPIGATTQSTGYFSALQLIVSGVVGGFTHANTVSRFWNFPDASGDVILNSATQNITSKTITSSSLTATALSLLIGGAKAIFSHANTADRTYTFPDVTGNVLIDTATQNVSNKTIDSSPIGTTTRALGYFSALREYIGGFAAIFTHANTADRTYTLPDKSITLGTLAKSRQYFSASGTWSKPANCVFVEVICVAGGSGGGSGRRGATSSPRGGGGGGAAGGVTVMTWEASQLGSSETVTIGAGGAGGGTIGTNDTNGANGTQGGDTFFGGTTAANSKQMASASSGVLGGGRGGSNVQVNGGVGVTTLGSFLQFYGADGGAGSTGPATVFAGSVPAWGPGAGGGAGGTSGANAAVDGQAGGDGQGAAFRTTATGGGGAVGSTSNGTAGANGTTDGSSVDMFGSGGGGAGSGTSGAGFTGGAGGAPGGGGGGGSGSTNGSTSGAGGAGADGGVWVISYCSA